MITILNSTPFYYDYVQVVSNPYQYMYSAFTGKILVPPKGSGTVSYMGMETNSLIFLYAPKTNSVVITDDRIVFEQIQNIYIEYKEEDNDYIFKRLFLLGKDYMMNAAISETNRKYNKVIMSESLLEKVVAEFYQRKNELEPVKPEWYSS